MTDYSTIKEKLEPIARQYGVKKMYIFGSYAKGTATEKSDIDLIIEKGAPISLLKISGMKLDCQEALGIPVDLLTTDAIGADFQKEIDGTEVLIYAV